MHRENIRGVSIFLWGTVWGSFFARRYLTVYKDGIDGVILLGTGAPKDAEVRFGYMLADSVCKRKGTRYRSKMLYNLSLGNYNRNSSRRRRLTTGCPGMKRETAPSGTTR